MTASSVSVGKWTKGPWRLQQVNRWPFDLDIVGGDGSVVVNQRRAAHSTDQKTLADCLAGVGFKEDGTTPDFQRSVVVVALQKQVSDFHLIAAAPELYDRLERVTRIWSNAPGLDAATFNAAMRDAIREAKAALAKARGEQS